LVEGESVGGIVRECWFELSVSLLDDFVPFLVPRLCVLEPQRKAYEV
jgi:hypothetical protein